MSNRKWREQTFAELGRVGMGFEDSRWLLRQSATLHRLAEAQCNGDWPFDNGERRTVVCPECEGGCVRASMRRIGGKGEAVCPDCATSARVRAKVAGWVESGRYPGLLRVELQGDPRGCVLRVVFAREGGGEREVGIAG